MKVLFFLLLILISCNNSTKKEIAKKPSILEGDCSCINDFKPENAFNETRGVNLINVNIEKKNSRKFIVGNCVDVMRNYRSGPSGEYETESVVCKSKNEVHIEITDSTKFHFYISGPEVLNNDEGKKYFFEKLIPNKKSVIGVEVEKEKNIALTISRRENLEKTD